VRIRLTAAPDDIGLQADTEGRRITGTIVPFGAEGRPSVGPSRIVFAADADLHVPDELVLNLEHDPTRPIGRSIELTRADDGLRGVFRIASTTAGTDALAEAADGLRGGLSIEADQVDGTEHEGLYTIRAARVTEVALVRRPAFTDATVTDVAATADTTNTEGNPMSEQSAVTETVEVEAAAPIPTPAPLTVIERPMPTPGEYVLASLAGDQTHMQDMRRRVMAAAPHTFLAEVPGLLPEQIVGPIVNMAADTDAPTFAALGRNAAPKGESFSIPVVSPNLPAAAAATEKTDVTQQLGVAKVGVTLTFVKRAVNLSAEAVAWSQPSLIDVAVMELGYALNAGSEAVITAGLEAATGTNTAVALLADGSDAWSKLAAAVSDQYQASGQRPDVFACAPDLWAALAGMNNTLGQPLIGGVQQTLTGEWGNLFGIPVVVSASFTAGQGFLVGRRGVKSWDSGSLEMRVNEATILGYAIGAGRGVGLSVADGTFITPVSIAP
jgi:phage head maturation protease